MKILIISLFYLPEPVARPHDLAISLVQSGHHVSVITAFPNYPNGKIYPGYRIGSAKWEDIDGVKVLRIPHLVDRSKSAFKRILSYLSFSLSAVLYSLLRMEKPDVLWTYQIGLPGLILSKLLQIPLVHEVQDLWPEWGNNAKLGLGKVAYHILERQEQMIYRQAHKIVTITEGFKTVFINKRTDPSKIEIIPNWANDAIFHPDKADAELALKEGFIGNFNIVYIGNVGVAQALGVIIDAAVQLKDFPEILFSIIGDGLERAELENRAYVNGVNNVRFLGSRSQNEAAKYMALADVLFIHLKRDPVYKITIPSKTYGYLASGRPILAAAEGELNDLIKKHQAGIVCPPQDASALANAVRKFRKMPKEELEKMGNAGYHAAKDNYSRSALGKQYSDLFENTVKSFREEKT
ncbi:MAG: glycosyltransferase family 4 protein [Anaerolineaceae bacterium]|nr:glycosyltransferase family 4 protein [Anaerolineaceae bacterium]